MAVTALAPAIWGTTYLVTSELLPPDRPLLAAVVRALPAGILLTALTRQFPRGDWWWRALVLGTLNIGAFFALLFVAAYRLPAASRPRSARSSRCSWRACPPACSANACAPARSWPARPVSRA
jgi:hypothetical protein